MSPSSNPEPLPAPAHVSPSSSPEPPPIPESAGTIAAQVDGYIMDTSRLKLEDGYLRWTVLNPKVRGGDDGKEHDAVYRGIINLWRELKSGRIRNKASFNDWVSRGQSIYVICAPDEPGVRSLRSVTRIGMRP